MYVTIFQGKLLAKEISDSWWRNDPGKGALDILILCRNSFQVQRFSAITAKCVNYLI